MQMELARHLEQLNKEMDEQLLVDLQVRSVTFTAISINVVGSKHKAKRQDRKFTWDFL